MAGEQGPTRFPAGVWLGSVERSLVESGGKAISGRLTVSINSCDGNIEVFTKGENGEVHAMPPIKAIQSLDGSHLFYYMAAEPKQPDWEEIQTFSLLELNDKKIWLFWTRAVNNRDLEIDHPNRYFRSTTMGELNRTASDCLTENDGTSGDQKP